MIALQSAVHLVLMASTLYDATFDVMLFFFMILPGFRVLYLYKNLNDFNAVLELWDEYFGSDMLCFEREVSPI